MLWRLFRPAFCERFGGAETADLRIGIAGLAEVLRPRLHDDVEEVGGDLPVFGEGGAEFAGEGFELAPVDAADEGGLVDEGAEFICGGK